MAMLDAIIYNFQNSRFYYPIFCIIIAKFKAIQKWNKRRWIGSDQFCGCT